MPVRTTVAAVSILVAALSACGTKSDASETTLGRGNEPTTTSTVQQAPAAHVPPVLAGTTWRYESNITVGGLRPVPSGTGAAVTFTADGTVEVNTGCNTGTAGVTFRGEYELVLGAMSLTEIACTDPDRAAVESGMLFVLAEPMSWSVHDGILTLIPSNITDTGLHLSPAP